MIFKPKTIQIEFDVSNLTLIEAEQAYRGLVNDPWCIKVYSDTRGVPNLEGTRYKVGYEAVGFP